MASTLNKRGRIFLVVFSLLAAVMTAFGAASAGAAVRPVQAGSATPGVPTSTVGVMGEKVVRYCVKNYQPDSTVTVTNELTGQSVKIHTNRTGAGCAEVPLKRGCRATKQTIVASGIGDNGKPATSSAVVTAPATPSLCSAAGTKHTSSGSLAFTGATGIMLMVLIGLVLVALGTAAVVIGRRRRSAATV